MLAPLEDIREVKNTYQAYEQLQRLNMYSVNDLLKAHKLMTEGLVKESNYVPDLINQLFKWLKKSNMHPLVKSCIFHYEFEFIHPFADGNGRTGRLWHTLILQNWKDFLHGYQLKL